MRAVTRARAHHTLAGALRLFRKSPIDVREKAVATVAASVATVAALWSPVLLQELACRFQAGPARVHAARSAVRADDAWTVGSRIGLDQRGKFRRNRATLKK